MPCPTPTARYATHFAVVVLGSSLLASSGYSETAISKDAQSIPTGVTLLTGAEPIMGKGLAQVARQQQQLWRIPETRTVKQNGNSDQTHQEYNPEKLCKIRRNH